MRTAIRLLMVGLSAAGAGCGPSAEQLLAEGNALEAQAKTRLAAVLKAGEPQDLETEKRCPDDLRAKKVRPEHGKSMVAHREQLAWAVAGRDWQNVPKSGASMSSRSLVWLMEEPVRGNADSLKLRKEGLQRILSAPFLVTVVDAASDAPKKTGEHAFEGGSASGYLVVHDAETGEALCHTAFQSQLLFSVSLKQGRGVDQASADRMALQSSAATRYWMAVKDALGRITDAVDVEAQY